MSFSIRSIALLNEDVFLLGWAYNWEMPYFTEYFIKGNDNNWAIADSAPSPNLNPRESAKWGSHGIFQTSDGRTYSFGYDGVWKLQNNLTHWEKVFQENITIRGMQGPNSNYLMATADFGVVLYYDGVEWIRLQNLIENQQNIQFYDAWTNGSEAFVVGQITDSFPMRTVILHGK